MDRYKELVERLNACRLEYSDGQPCGYGPPINPDGSEAAKAITDLLEERERLQDAWTSEAISLPNIGQQVLVATPDIYGEFFQITVAALLIRHEDVTPKPVATWDKSPTDYYWGNPRTLKDTMLLNGQRWWAPFTVLPLPPNALHKNIRGYDVIVQSDAALKEGDKG